MIGSDLPFYPLFRDGVKRMRRRREGNTLDILQEPARSLPVVEPFEVVVAGSGVAGVAAG